MDDLTANCASEKKGVLSLWFCHQIPVVAHTRSLPHFGVTEPSPRSSHRGLPARAACLLILGRYKGTWEQGEQGSLGGLVLTGPSSMLQDPASPWIFDWEEGPSLARGWCLALLCSALWSGISFLSGSPALACLALRHQHHNPLLLSVSRPLTAEQTPSRQLHFLSHIEGELLGQVNHERRHILIAR